MIRRLAVLCLLLAAASGCSSNKKVANPTSTTTPSVRKYTGTASVGDFLTITLDATAHTLTYANRSNGDAGVIAYTVNGDGSYAFTDPTGNLVSAYEVPNFVLLVQLAKAGPSHDTPALVTAVQSAPATLASLANRHTNYMQFRTSSGGVEIGACNVDAQGAVSLTSYWPYGSMSASDSFHNNTGGVGDLVEDPSGRFLTSVSAPGDTDYVFFTPSGVFAVDTQNGAILGFAQTATKDFDPTNAGTYRTIFYRKLDATMSMGNVESGTGTLGDGTVTVSSTGAFTLTSGVTTLASGTLVPVADATYLVGPDKLTDPCNGLFTIRTSGGGLRQDVFCTFLNGAILFSSFKTAIPMQGNNPYDYFYGVALR